jgi:putative Holliday junction resolvase
MDIDYNKTDLALKFKNQSIMAIDYGRKFTGIAMFRPGFDLNPYPYTRIAYKSDEQICQDIFKLIEDELVEILILGLPYLLDGKSTSMTKTMIKFGKYLNEFLGEKKVIIPLFSQDETLSSFEAKDRMLKSPRYNFQIDMKQIDAVAASIILEDFLKSDETLLITDITK